MTDRAQSEALSFVFVFGIIVATVALVFAVGYPGLQQTQDFERVNNAERALTSLATSVDDQVQAGAPSRATEVKLTDASLSVGAAETITVDSVDGDFVSTTVVSRPLVYDSGTGTQLTYASGMVARQQSAGMVTVRDPQLVVGTDATVLAIPSVRSTESSIGGQATVLVRTDRTDTEPAISYDGPGKTTVSVTVDSPRAALWKAYFEQRFADEGMTGGSCTDVVDDSVTCTFETGKLYVTAVPVDLSFS